MKESHNSGAFYSRSSNHLQAAPDNGTMLVETNDEIHIKVDCCHVTIFVLFFVP